MAVLVGLGEDVGVCVGASKLTSDAGLIALPMDNVPWLKVGALWTCALFPELQTLLAAMEQAARELAPPGSAFAASAGQVAISGTGPKVTVTPSPAVPTGLATVLPPPDGPAARRHRGKTRR